MKSKIHTLTFVILALSILVSCKNSNTGMHKNITGKAGELVVVISKELWDEAPGKAIRETLAQPNIGLPQDEPLFDLVDVPPSAFKSIFQSTRNILQTTISPSVDSVGVTFKDDVWAYPQATVQVKAKSQNQFVEIFNKNKIKIISYYISAERERLTKTYSKYFEKTIFNVLNKDFNVTMKVPPGFVIASQKKDFLWFRYETPAISQGIIFYTFPYVSDSTFTEGYLLPIRDSILKANVPGPTDGSYMATERRTEQIFNTREHNGNYAVEMRGLWYVKNDFMGGPYISLAELDAASQRVVVAFGYIYAPGKEKRNFVRQVEAMIYSLKLNDQAKNDKIQSQIKMGN